MNEQMLAGRAALINVYRTKTRPRTRQKMRLASRSRGTPHEAYRSFTSSLIGLRGATAVTTRLAPAAIATTFAPGPTP